MNISVTGASASAGVDLEVVKRTLERGHQVTTLSRSKIPVTQNTRLIALKGSATNKTDLKKSIENADAVIVALATGKRIRPASLYSDFAILLANIHEEARLQIPVIVLTGFGAGESGKYHDSFITRFLFKLLLKDVYADKTRMEEIISGSTMRWVTVPPGVLRDQPLTERYKVENHVSKGIHTGSINRTDVAGFMIKQAGIPTEIRKYPALANQ